MQSSGVSLNPEQQLSCRRIFQENTYAHACIELLSTKLMENGIVVRRGKTESPRDLQDLVDRYYPAFVKECLISMFLYGFIAWDTCIVDKNRVPVVIPGTHIRVEVDLEEGNVMPTYRAKSTITDDYVRYFQMTSPPDLVDRVIDSPFCKILPYHLFEVSILQNAARADRRNADTPLVLENTAANPGFWAMKNVEPLDAAGVDMYDEKGYEELGNEMGCRVQSRMHCTDEVLVKLQDNYTRHLNTIGELDAMQQSKLYTKTKQETLPRLQLPPHTKVQNVNFPHTRADLKEIVRMNAERICIACGVPAELMIKNHHVKHDESQSMNVVIDRVTELRRVIQPILSRAFTECTKYKDALSYIATGDETFTENPTIELKSQMPMTDDLVRLVDPAAQAKIKGIRDLITDGVGKRPLQDVCDDVYQYYNKEVRGLVRRKKKWTKKSIADHIQKTETDMTVALEMDQRCIMQCMQHLRENMIDDTTNMIYAPHVNTYLKLSTHLHKMAGMTAKQK